MRARDRRTRRPSRALAARVGPVLHASRAGLSLVRACRAVLLVGGLALARSSAADEPLASSAEALAQVARAEWALVSGDAATALDATERALVSDPRSPALVIRLMALARAEGLPIAWSRWRAALERLDRRRAGSWLWVARAAREEGELEDARRALDEALRREVGSDAWLEAAALAVELQPARGTRAERFDAWLVHAARRQPALASAVARRAWAQAEPRRALAALERRGRPDALLVTALDRAGEVDRAALLAQQLAAAAPADAELGAQARALARRATSPEVARDRVEAQLAAAHALVLAASPSAAPEPSLPTSSATVADWAERRAGSTRVPWSAEDHVAAERAWAAAPDDARAVAVFAASLEQRGLRAEAARHFRRALGLEPGLRAAAQGVARLEPARARERP
jgi:tetratricopeptide (TPR) repeat protein